MSSLIERLSYFVGAGAFIAKKHIVGYKVNPSPTFDPQARAAFERLAKSAEVYLEYGSGGSTLLASQFVKKLVSVETDPVFMKAVSKVLPPTEAEIHLLTPNIGATHLWGAPVFGKPTPRRIKRWKTYPDAPWKFFKSRAPDLVLVDGRFRVACVLTTLLNVNRDTTILMDDYAFRDYSSINPFVDLIRLHGNMAEVRKRVGFDEYECGIVLDKSYSDFM